MDSVNMGYTEAADGIAYDLISLGLAEASSRDALVQYFYSRMVTETESSQKCLALAFDEGVRTAFQYAAKALLGELRGEKIRNKYYDDGLVVNHN